MAHKYILGQILKTKSKSRAMALSHAQGRPEHAIEPSVYETWRSEAKRQTPAHRIETADAANRCQFDYGANTRQQQKNTQSNNIKSIIKKNKTKNQNNQT